MRRGTNAVERDAHGAATELWNTGRMIMKKIRRFFDGPTLSISEPIIGELD
jgi:hypothetical protein